MRISNEQGSEYVTQRGSSISLLEKKHQAFLAGRTARSTISFCYDTVVRRPSVSPWRCALWRSRAV